MIIPEEHGGSGLGAVEAGVMAEALGRTLTPSPFLGSSVLSAKVLLDGGSVEQQAAWLPRIAAGEAIVSLAVDEGAKHAPTRIATVAERSGNGGWRTTPMAAQHNPGIYIIGRSGRSRLRLATTASDSEATGREVFVGQGTANYD